MDWRRGLSIVVLVSSIVIFGRVVFAQQDWAGDISAVPDVQWLWGEVVSLDTAKGEVVVRFLDYETEQDKEVSIAVDEKTTYENVNSLAQIKIADTVSVDYVVDKDARNVAKNISVEKPEEINAPQISLPFEPALKSAPEELSDLAQPSEESSGQQSIELE